jgi:hypothetical protein
MSRATGEAKWPRGCAVAVSRVAALVIPGVILAGVGPVVLRWLVLDARSLAFPLADGVVTVSEAKKQGRMERYDWTLEYAYIVDGREHTGRRYDYAQVMYGWFHHDDMNRLLAAFPVGARVGVAYNPADPSDSALRPGQPGQLFERAALALFVFGLAAAYFWFALLGPPADAPCPRQFNPDDPRQVAPAADGFRVRLPAVPLIHPLLVFLAAGCLIVLITRVRPTAPDPYPWWAGFLIVVGTPVLIVLIAVLSRRPVLHLDSARRVLIHEPGWPWSRVKIAFGAVAEVRVAPRTEQRKGGHVAVFHQVVVTHAVAKWSWPVVLCEYEHEADADALAAWLRERVGLSSPRPQWGGNRPTPCDSE